MKKMKFVAPVVLASALLFCACKASTPAIGLSANWNKDTTISTIDPNKSVLETLVYDVTFTEPQKPGNYAVHYGKGTYTTTLETYRFDNMESSRYGYHYRTELNIPVWFTIGAETSETYQDTLVSEVWFLDLAHALQPVESKKYGSSYTPVGNSPKSMQDDYFVHYSDYLCHILYNDPLTEASVTVSYDMKTSSQLNTPTTQAEEGEEDKAEPIKTSLKSTNYFDNEQLLFVLRGYDMQKSASLGTLNPASFKSQSKVTVTAPSAVSHSVKFTMTEGGTTTAVGSDNEAKNIDAYETTISYSGGMAGQAQKLVYAATTDTKLNEYRNVLLSYEAPLYSSLGMLQYTLRAATFY